LKGIEAPEGLERADEGWRAGAHSGHLVKDMEQVASGVEK